MATRRRDGNQWPPSIRFRLLILDGCVGRGSATTASFAFIPRDMGSSLHLNSVKAKFIYGNWAFQTLQDEGNSFWDNYIPLLVSTKQRNRRPGRFWSSWSSPAEEQTLQHEFRYPLDRWLSSLSPYLSVSISDKKGGAWEGMAFNGNDISSVQFTRPHPVLLNRRVVEEDHSTIFIIIILNRWPNFKPNSQFESSCASGRKEGERMRRVVVVLNVHPPKHGCVSPVGPQLL